MRVMRRVVIDAIRRQPHERKVDQWQQHHYDGDDEQVDLVEDRGFRTSRDGLDGGQNRVVRRVGRVAIHELITLLLAGGRIPVNEIVDFDWHSAGGSA